ncbi:GMC family oxidoreductase [Phenylobacterium sp.]|uniref:GMC family oxidoreductase n=1 Tax=Phenylobacterium sp. TaxID=1871053 RepID=UPI003565A358
MICPPDGAASPIETEVAIVGAGPAGLALALALGRAGVNTAVIESGSEGQASWTRKLAVAETLEPGNHAAVEVSTHRRLGGASWIWGGRCVDFDPVDFEARSGAEPPGWPISYADAISEAAPAAAFLGIGPPAFDEDFDWLPREGLLRARLERWCGDSHLARRHGADIRDSRMVRFWTGLTCTSVALDSEGRRAVGLCVKSRSGAPRVVTADHYVIAAGGIESARLLLASTDLNRALPGTDSWLGRGYMGHMEGTVADLVLDGLQEEQIDYRRDRECYVRPRLMFSEEALKSEGLVNIGFVADNSRLGDWRHGSGALSAAALALATPAVGEALQPGPIRKILLGRRLSPQDVVMHLRNIVLDAPRAAAFLGRVAATRYRRPASPGLLARNRARRYRLRYFSEQSVLRDSRILLSRTLDPLGLPRVRIEKRVCERDVDSVIRAHLILDRELRRTGLGRLEFREDVSTLSGQLTADGADGYHQIGTVRMSADPADGVVDANCRVHGTSNLHVVGAAVFPTSGQANPTYLAVCLSLRLARRLIVEIKG